MRRKYIVLRDTTPAPEKSTRDGRSAVVDPDAIAASSEDHAPGAKDLQEDDSVLGWAPAMPLALVRPRTASAAASATDEPPAPDRRVAWGVRAVRADASQYTGDGVSVAVLDTGIVAGHPAFAKLKKLEQMDFTGDGSGDRNGHGTHCAGTIFGGEVNGMRIGVAPGIRAAYIGKVLDDAGRGSTDRLVEGLLWAAKNRAQVIAMSLGIDYPGYVKQLIATEDLPPEFAASQALDAFRSSVLMFEQVAGLIRSQVPKGVVVAAAGNESQREMRADFRIGVSLPAATQGIISVAALARTAQGLAVAQFSNIDAVVSAPGVDIESAGLDGGLATMSGTSMAAPHVAGIAALWAEKLRKTPTREASELRARVVTSVTEQGLEPGFDARDVGSGLALAP